jgi:putative membrane-bound dehydrogenase-like protein
MQRSALLFLALTAATVSAQVPPEKSISTFKTSPGLEISLWASEPLLVNPTCCDVDHKGRVWVCESVNYRHKLRNKPPVRPEGDRILILEDTKGTGKADKVTVFYQSPDTLAPLGIAVLPYPDGKGVKVYVCQSPDILVFEDKDGDGKVDGPPTKLLTGFGGYDHDHGVHGILIGPDNKLYFTVGDTGVRNLKSSDSKGTAWTVYNSNNSDCQAATVWRCDLDGKNLELIAHNFRNNYEPCVDSFGTVFLSDNDDDGNQQTRICYVMKGGNYGYHRNPKTSHWNEEHPGIVPKILRTYFGSPTGICVYEGNLLPKEYQGQLIHVDAGPRHLRCYHLSSLGASYKVDREDMVESSDNWFRPSDVCVAPDGSLIVADWYDPGVGGHGMGDTTRGRIYRVAPTGSKSSVPALDIQTPAGLTAAIRSPNLAVRAVAMGRLASIDREDALKVLVPAVTQKQDRVLRARALWQLGRMGHLIHVTAAFEEADPEFRIEAMRIFRDFRNLSPAEYTEDWQSRLINDSSAAVRREGLLLLQDADPIKAAPLIHALASKYDGKDRFYLAAVGIAVGHHDVKRREVLLADFEKQYPGWSDTIAGLIWELRPPQAAEILTARLDDPKLTTAQRLQVVDILASSDNPKASTAVVAALGREKDAAIRERLTIRLRENLGKNWKNLIGSAALGDVVRVQVKENDPEALDLIAAGELQEFVPFVIGQIDNPKSKASLKLDAVRTLGVLKTPGAQAALAKVAEAKDAVLASEAVQALGRQGTPAALKTLRSLVQNDKEPQPIRQAAVAGLAAHKASSVWLLDDFAEKKIAKDLNSDLSRLLRNSPYSDVKKRAEATLPAPPKLDPKNLPSISALLTRKGNAIRGKDLLAATIKNDAACLKCHIVNGVGGKVGPELSVIGSKASRENLLESILYPSRAIAHQYSTFIVETKDGKTITGVIGEETPTYIVLRDANANEHKIATSAIESKAESPISLMPADLILHLPENDLIDLVEYLYSLKSPTLTPTGLTQDDSLTTQRREKRK